MASLSCSRNNCTKCPIFAKSEYQFFPDLFLIGTESKPKGNCRGEKNEPLLAIKIMTRLWEFYVRLEKIKAFDYSVFMASKYDAPTEIIKFLTLPFENFQAATLVLGPT